METTITTATDRAVRQPQQQHERYSNSGSYNHSGSGSNPYGSYGTSGGGNTHNGTYSGSTTATNQWGQTYHSSTGCRSNGYVYHGAVVTNPVYGHYPAWGWNAGIAWYPAPYYWGGGFWGAFAIGAASAAVYGSIVAANNVTYTSYETQPESPGAKLLSSYHLTQTQCGAPNLATPPAEITALSAPIRITSFRPAITARLPDPNDRLGETRLLSSVPR